MTTRIILDVDTGTDDAVAIMFAALHPEIDVLGITTVNGKVPLPNATDNTLRVLDRIGRPDIPVFPGLSRPIARNGFPDSRRTAPDSENDPHGSTLPIPPATTAPRERGAVEYLVETLRATTEPITLVAVGPLSNIATALALDPDLPDAVAELVIMGGGHSVANVTASAEFNIWADPEAASAVLAAGFERLTLVPLDATHQALITRADCKSLDELGTPAGSAAARFIERRINACSGADSADGAAPVHDVVCTAHLVRPDIIATRHLPVTVETAGALTIGRTVVDTRPNSPARPNAHVATAAEAELLAALLSTTFARDGRSPA